MNKYEREQAIQEARNSVVGYSVAVALGRLAQIEEDYGLDQEALGIELCGECGVFIEAKDAAWDQDCYICRDCASQKL